MKSDDPETKIANIPPFGVRMQPDLKRQLEEAARRNRRSLNAEVVARLEFTLSIDWQSEGDGGAATAIGPGSPEWDEATRKTQTLEKRVEQLEQRLALIEAKRR